MWHARLPNAWFRLLDRAWTSEGLYHTRKLSNAPDWEHASTATNDLRDNRTWNLPPMIDTHTRTQLEAAAFRRLTQHLQEHPEIQNIELMLTADFCRNCLAKWLKAAADERGITLDDASAREMVYGEPYEQWKAKHQVEATPDQLQAFEERQRRQALDRGEANA